MRKAIPLALAPLVVLALAVPAIGQSSRDRLLVSGTTADGVTISATVVDSDLGDSFTVSTSYTEACRYRNITSTIVTLTNLTLDDPVVEVPQRLKSVDGSGTGTQFVTVIDNCRETFTTTPVAGVAATITGERTSRVENLGGGNLRGTGTGTLTVGDVTADVAITFTRQPLP